MALTSISMSRKERRKAERLKKRKNRDHHHHTHTHGQDLVEEQEDLKKQNASQKHQGGDGGPMRKKIKRKGEKRNEPPTKSSSSSSKKKTKKMKAVTKQTAADDGEDENSSPFESAIRRDEEEIAELEAKLGLKKNKKSKDKLNKEYAKLEGFGDDFGDFLDDLDDMVLRVQRGGRDGGEEKNKEHLDGEDGSDDDDSDSNHSQDDEISEDDGDEVDDIQETTRQIDPDLEAALRREDEEIKELEQKLGMGNKKNKAKINKEYSTEGYGDDFGDFLDGLDDMMNRVSSNSRGDMEYYVKKMMKNAKQDGHGSDENDDESDASSEEDDEEIVPMKDPFENMDEDDSVLDEIEKNEAKGGDDDECSSEEEPYARNENNVRDDDPADENDSDEDSKEGKDAAPSGSDSDTNSESDSDDESAEPEPDHDVADTYRPSEGEDIYGNNLDAADSGKKTPGKYVPPHLRNQGSQNRNVDAKNQEQLRQIQRLLNNALNRLSDDTLVSVAQQLAQIYTSNPTQSVNEMLWKNTMQACVATPMLMTGLIPVYVACIVGAHIQTGDTIQIGEFILEQVVSEMWKGLQEIRKGEADDANVDDELASKATCNLTVILCYLYNFNIVHCTFMYDIIRHFISEFTEVDVECLLLLLSHAGQSLRSDDPLALKEIVLLVQKRKSQGSMSCSSSRADYMVSAIMDLKNNKRRKQDSPYSERSSKLKKMIGRIKSAASKLGNAKTSSETSHRISLQDILDAETKGRWWKVGASWIGNQYRFDESNGDGKDDAKDDENGEGVKVTTGSRDEDEKLLKLASKLRMNTDRKRAIFCIIMGGSDCEDAFEKLCRSSMLQNRSERDTVRVLMECCGNEKSYNRFYGHLANRICEYQPQSRFSLQLAYWDTFKQFDTMGARKAANLAKLLFNVVCVHQVVRLLPVLRGMDVSDADMPNSQTIFLTILMSSVLDYVEHPAHAKSLFAVSDPTKEEQNEGVRAGLLVFFLEVLKASPKNEKGSKFRKNFKAIVKELDTDGFENMF